MAFKDGLKKFIDFGVTASKGAVSKAGSAMSKFGDESVVRLEKIQLEKLLSQEISALGEFVYKYSEEEKKESLVFSDEAVRVYLDKIRGLKADITRREEALKKLSETVVPGTKTEAAKAENSVAPAPSAEASVAPSEAASALVEAVSEAPASTEEKA